MLAKLMDKKSKFAHNALGWLCRKVVANRFPNLEIVGLESIPRTGSFLLLANHTARWDPLVIHTLLNREANYMTHPNELKGLQGLLLPAVGAFPADRRYDLDEFMIRQARLGEPLVIFPEGGVFTDRQLHPFKKGTAHTLLACHEAGLDLPIVPVAIEYTGDGGKIVISPPLRVVTNTPIAEMEKKNVITSLTQALHERMNLIKQSLLPESLPQAS
jgi:1-acyl-sn-glycerol-3-phosphate acyltransferase